MGRTICNRFLKENNFIGFTSFPAYPLFFRNASFLYSIDQSLEFKPK